MLKKKHVFSYITIIIIVYLFCPFSSASAEEADWNNEIIYSLMVDRFNNGNNANDFNVDRMDLQAFQGGDFQGIIEKLDYIKNMNFTVVQLSPIFLNDHGSVTGEKIKKYDEIDPHFGTKEEFNDLINEVHQRNMKIILEIPIQANMDKADWEDITWWIDNTDIDGIQLNHIDLLPHHVWQEIITTLEKNREELYISGVSESMSEQDIEEYNKVGFERIANVPLNQSIRTVFSKPNQSLTADMLAQTQEKANKGVAFLDNPYTDRFTRDLVNHDRYPGVGWKLALTFLYSQPEIPNVYFGSEIALNGGKPIEDPIIMNFRTDKELIDYITVLGKIRSEQPALSKGSLELLYEKDGMIIFKRQYKSAVNIIALNNTLVDQTVAISNKEIGANRELRGLIGTDLVRSNDGEFKIHVKRENAEIYNVTHNSGLNWPFIIIIPSIFILFLLFLLLASKRGRTK